jgi:hypothetical protein
VSSGATVQIDTRLSPNSFRDPNGTLVIVDGRVFRLMTIAAGEVLEKKILSAPSVRRWVKEGKLIETERANEGSLPASLRALPLAIFEHPRIPFVSYAFEWSPAMLAEAAGFTLKFNADLLDDGLTLKDATPANVLFRGSNPVFVDILSIVTRPTGKFLWAPANQFDSTFLLPLLVNRELGLPLQSSLQDTFSGLSYKDAARLLGMRRWLKPRLIVPVALPAALSRNRSTMVGASPVHRNDDAAKFTLRRTLQQRQIRIDQFAKNRSGSFWQSYTEARQHYSDSDIAEKIDFVSQALEEIRPQWTLDVGANTGEFSTIASRYSNVVALDIDEEASSAIFVMARREQLNIQSLVCNFARPSPGLGWENAETQSLLDRIRGRFDFVLMLAVIHHLRTTAGIPLIRILDVAKSITTKHLLVEFVPPQDPMFKQLAKGREDIYTDWMLDQFEYEFTRRFTVLRKVSLPNSRVLFLGEVLRNPR